jgi:filamentous hemagglutinin
VLAGSAVLSAVGGVGALAQEARAAGAARGGIARLNPGGLLGRQGPAEMTKSRIGKMTQAMKEGKFDWDAAGPIRVAERDGTRIIIDGHHRAAAARRAGLSEVPVLVEQVTDEVWNRLRMEAAEAAGR